MSVAYMGLFATIFNWIFEKILSPIVEFVANLLSKVFEWIFNTILMPILTIVFKTVFPWIIETLKTLFAGVLVGALGYICKIIGYLEKCFKVFAGTSPVTDTVTKQQDTLLNVMLCQSSVQKAFYLICAVAFGMAMIFAVIAVAKSTLDFDFENKRPVGAVMRALLKTVLRFLIIPLMVLFILSLSNVMLQAISDATTAADPANKPGDLGRVLFTIATLDAAKCDQNVSNSGASGQNLLLSSTRKSYYTGIGNNHTDLTKLDEIDDWFEFKKFDFATGIVVGIFLIVILAINAIVFIQRIFEVIVLFLVCPFFVSTMPLDDGEKYNKWKELFIGKIFSGYGAVLAMNLYLMLVPTIMDNSISYGSDISNEASYLIKLIFLVGGAWAVTKIGPMITTIISFQAGQSEQQTGDMVNRYAGSAISSAANWTAGKAIGAVGATFGAIGGAASMINPFASNPRSKEIADKKFDRMLKNQEKEFKKEPGEGDNKDKIGEKSRLDSEGVGKSKEDKEDKLGTSTDLKSDSMSSTAKSGEDGEHKELGEAKSGLDISSGGDDKKDKEGNEADIAKKELGSDGEKGGLGDSEKGDLADGKNKFKEGAKLKPNKFDKFLNFAHRVLPHSENPDGSYSFSFMGFGVNYDKDGNKTGFKVPFCSFDYGHEKGNPIRLKSFDCGLCKLERSNKDGSMGLSSIPMIGLNRKQDPNGDFHVSSVAGLKFGMGYNKEKDSYEVSGVRVGNMIFGGGGNNAKKD